MNEATLQSEHRGMTEAELPDPCAVVIFGASGDLTHKELVPALYSLKCKGLLNGSAPIVGFARQDLGEEGFRRRMREAVEKTADCGGEEWERFSRRLHYVCGDFTDEPSGGYANLHKRLCRLQDEAGVPDNVLFHLATPPGFYATIVDRLDRACMMKSDGGWRRVIIEKPFGESENSARALHRQIHQVLGEDQVYRIDHYLGKETVQNMLAFRFANPGFEPIWNRNYIDNVQITVAESVGIGTRGSFYEKTGVVRDMVQNHLLELLCMIAAEPPLCFDSVSLRTETVKVLKSICPIDVSSDCVLGQYGAGTSDREKVRGYRGEENVAGDSNTPTFAALRLKIDNWRWADVPFFLRTGKRLNHKMTEVTIQFKPTPHLMFPSAKGGRLGRSVLTFRLQPDEGIAYTLMAKQPGAQFRLKPVNLNFNYHRAFGIDEPPSAYQWLLYDAMKGDQTLFPRADWIYEAWSIVDPIIERWESEPWLEFPNYPAGSWGPHEADELIKRDGHGWNVS